MLTIFVLPEYQGQGVGRRIIQTLEQDEFFLRAKRIEIPASVTAVEFYKKLGYNYKNGIAELDDEQLCRLEKYRAGEGDGYDKKTVSLGEAEGFCGDL